MRYDRDMAEYEKNLEIAKRNAELVGTKRVASEIKEEAGQLETI